MIGYFVITRAIRQRIYDDAVAEFLAQEERIVRPGLSDAAMARHELIAAPEPSKGEQPDNCSVCMEPMAPGQPCRQLNPCHHIFHVECADTWLGRSTACPMCRADLRTEEERAEANAALAQAAARFEQRTGMQPHQPPPPAPPRAAPAAAAAEAPGSGRTGGGDAAGAPRPGAGAGGEAANEAVSAVIELTPVTAAAARPREAGSRREGHAGGAAAADVLPGVVEGGQTSRSSPPGSARPGPAAVPRGGGGGGAVIVASSRPGSNGSRGIVSPTTIAVLGAVPADGGFGDAAAEADARGPRYSNPLAPPPRMVGQGAGGGSRPSNAEAPLTRHMF